MRPLQLDEMHEFELALDDDDGAGDEGPAQPVRHWHLPRAPLLWTAAWLVLMALVPVASDHLDPFAGFIVLMVAFALPVWRAERWLGRQYWRGMRDFRS